MKTTKIIIEDQIIRICAEVTNKENKTFYVEIPAAHDITDDSLNEQSVRDEFYKVKSSYDELGNQLYYGDIIVTLLKE
jgi:hypothetical protein